MSSLKYFGVPIVSIGLANPKEDPTLEVLVKQDTEHDIYKKLVLKNNVIVRHDTCELHRPRGCFVLFNEECDKCEKTQRSTPLQTTLVGQHCQSSAEKNECGAIK